MEAPPCRRLLALFSAALLAAAPATTNKPAHPEPFQTSVQPFLAQNCYGCHNSKLKSGDVDISAFKSAASVGEDPEAWEKMAAKLLDGTMPPKGMPRPDRAKVDEFSAWVKSEVSRVELATKPNPGRVTARRLNRAEYNNTIRDLLGIDFHGADDFPQDDSGYGFDNIGDVLSLSPVLLEKYLKAAETAVRTALSGPERLKPTVLRSQPPGREFPLYPKPEKGYDITGLSMPNALHATMRFPGTGEYTFRVALEGRRPNGSEPLQIAVWIDGKQAGTVDIDRPTDGGSIDLFGAQAEVRLPITAGDHWVAASLLHLYEGLPSYYEGPNPSKRPEAVKPDVSRFMKVPVSATPEKIAEIKQQAEKRLERGKVPANRVWIHFVEAMGPFHQSVVNTAESRKRVLGCGHLTGQHVSGCDRKILAAFARKAFRRSIAPGELQGYEKLVADARKQGSSFDEAVGVGLQAILVSPDFLFRIDNAGLTTTDKQGQVKPISQFALASRLSYFLWSSMPDEELLRTAEQGLLRKPAVLQAQVKRMLQDSKSHALVENFAGQWLELRRLESVAPDREKFPEFDDYLRMSMRQETETFFANMVENDLSVMDLLNAKYTFANEKLARFYGIPGVQGTQFRKVSLDGTQRGGIVTQASVLTVSSYATRTSPVLRGKWILENLLNEPIPPPPPNVPALDEKQIGASASMRQQMEAHRSNPVCASCHSKMDPLGFGFENFNAIGQWRTKDGKFDINPAGALPDGRRFGGPEELKSLLGSDSAKFAACVTDKLLTYALGRGLERYDKRTVREIVDHAGRSGYRFSALVMEIVNSLPFQMVQQEQRKA